ncbi:exosortase family protein XrtF [Flavobacteriaceae bacterium R38]|nr:exosortase family protein XrtF [Flavobacteriaceae bacterium R38]
MIQILKKYKAAFYFILRFFVAYVILTLLYNQFLSSFINAPDTFTRAVAEQSRILNNFFNYESATQIVENESFVRFFVYDKYVARIIEGCNSISVLILFTSFIIAYRGNLKHTLVFVLLGGLFIYILNIIRVSILVVGLYRFPEYEYFMHQVLFPVIIYGAVFLLWVLWVNKYAKK